MQEIVDTNYDRKEIPEGRNTFRVINFKKNEKMYIFTFSYDGGKEGDQVFFASNLGPFLKILGCKESAPGVYILDTEVVLGKSFTATLFLEPSKKDATKMYRNMKDFDEVPF